MVGERLGGFEVVSEIGRGGMGVVYRARQLSLDREVALKTLMPGLQLDETLVERFGAEARAASRINHPNLVQVYDVGCEGGTHYLAMELVDGESLSSVVGREGSMDYLRAAATTSQVAAALGALHAAGIVHRDVKPSNILVRPDGMVKITDFGVALLRQEARRLTTDGTTVGTADYMSPEQAEGAELDGRSDIYSLGVVLYQLLTGEVPFKAETPLAVMKKHCEEQAPSIRRTRPDVPDRLAGIVARCLEKDPAERYQTAEALAADLDHVRLELEFAALSAETPAGGTASLYSTRTVDSLRRQQEARKPLLVRLLSHLWRPIPTAWQYAMGTLDRDVVRLRRAAGRMERALSGLAEAKRKRAELRQKAAELRERAERARRESGEAFDANEVVRAEELADEEKRCEAAAVDFESVAEGLSETVRELEADYGAARDEHERLRMKVELKQAQAIQESLGRAAAAKRQRTRHIVVALAAAAALCLAGYLVWYRFGRGGLPVEALPTSSAMETDQDSTVDGKVTLMPPYPASYAGAPTDRISLQFAVTEICRQVGLFYNWDESVKNVGGATRLWTTPRIHDLSWKEAMQHLLESKGLTYDRKGTNVILRRATVTPAVSSGSLVRLEGQPEIYLVYDGQYAWVRSDNTWKYAGYTAADIKVVPASALSGLERGEDIHTPSWVKRLLGETTPVTHGDIVQVDQEPPIYLIYGDHYAKVGNWDCLLQAGYTSGHVKSVEGEFLARLNRDEGVHRVEEVRRRVGAEAGSLP